MEEGGADNYEPDDLLVDRLNKLQHLEEGHGYRLCPLVMVDLGHYSALCRLV